MLALARQESEFYTNAVSSSGACGVMQLLPATAKETARKNGLPYSYNQLFDPTYNMTIGSVYMNKLVEKFDGSYVMAVASYNAGPARVWQWTEALGTPTNVHDTIDWVEKIPTSETRNYVEHVFENMEVYRFLLNGRSPASATIADDLVRFK
jgi:soluble lytic murein transglycosylase